MEFARTKDEVKRLCRELAVAHHDEHFERPMIGLTPTMGALHRGHLALVERMCAECDVSVVSIYVNPKQFAAGEDLERYPRAFDADVKLCSRAGVDLVFAPNDEEMYDQSFDTTVNVVELSKRWCGANRPGHFDGVVTVVAKLFGICGPDRAYFGEKDYQQLRVIERMVRDLDLPVEVVPCTTVREEDGLAMSSRNQYLSPIERAAAPRLYEALRRMAACFTGGVHDVKSLVVEAEHVLEAGRGPHAEVEYIAVVDPHTLEPRERAQVGDRAMIAARLGAARLIDNLALTGEEID